MRTPIYRSLRRTGRRIILSGTPARYRLVSEILIERMMGRLEDELLTLDAMTASRGMAIDIGANRGYYSYFMSRRFSQVVSFEPNEKVIQGLVKYAAPNVTIHHCALSSSDGTLKLYVPRHDSLDYSGWASFDRGHLEGWKDFDEQEVPIRQLDGFGFAGISLIKIDVEGHELKVLEGARVTLSESRPVVIVEIVERNRREAGRYFDELGYTARIVSKRSLQEIPEALEDYKGPKNTFVLTPSASGAHAR